MDEPSADRPFRRRVLVNTAAVGLSNGWAMVLALVGLPLTLHGLGSAAFGTWVLLQTFSAVNGWLSLLDLGIATAGTREVAARHGVDDERGLADAVGTTLIVLTALGLAAGLVFAVLAPFVLPVVFRTPDDLVHAFQLACVAFGFQAALDLVTGACSSVLDGYQRVDRARAIDVVRRTLVTAATAGIALATGSLVAVAVASAIATGIGTIVAWLTVRRTIRGLRPTSSAATARGLFHYGRTVGILRPLGVLHRTVDRFVVGIILGPSAVALVEVATQVQNGADAVLAATSYSVVPTAARLEAQGEQGKLVELVETGTRYSLLATWPLTMLAAVLAAPLIDVWVGPKYAEAATLIALASAALAILAPAQVGSNLLLGTGRARTILRIAAAAIVVNVGLSIALVHLIGVAGAFWATIAAALVTAPLLVLAVTTTLDLPLGAFVRSSLLPPLPAAVAAGLGAGAILALPLGSLTTLLLGGAVGAGSALLAAMAWGMSPAERQAVRRRLRVGRGADAPLPDA